MANGTYKVPTPVNEAIRSYGPGSPEKRSLKAELARQTASPVDIPLAIGEARVLERPRTKFYCPHNRSLCLGTYQEATAADVKQAITAALEARQRWANLPWEERAAVFLKAAELTATKYRDKINAATMLGQSKTCFQAEIDAACEFIDFLRFNAAFAQKIYEEQPVYSPLGQWNRNMVRPLEGFVFAVAPFNFTSIALNLACAPALMGCTVVWKPAPAGILAAYAGLQILEEAGLPPGVINMITGDAKLIGDHALASPDLAGIHFTGSTRTFEHLWSEVGKQVGRYRTYPRLVGETGGKDFVFAHQSADPKQLATALLRGAFEYQGQKCSAASRAYVPASLWPQVRDLLVADTNALKMGDPSDFSNFMAAVIDATAFEKITGYIEHAKTAKDARIVCGGEYDQSKGYFIRPTVIETTNPHYKSMVEEIFGPVLTVYAYPDDELAATLRLCDESTPYALTGAIFARDRQVIHELTAALVNTAGNFYINDKPTGAVVGQQPFGGARKSGTNDKAGSIFNLLRWVSHRTIKENFLAITDYRYPHMGES